MHTSHPGRALLVGVGQYPLLGEDQALDGAAEDALRVRALLTDRFGFDPARISVLQDAAATRDAILAGLAALAEAGPDEPVVFFYSGHGGQRLDPGEPDGRQETLVPCDSAHAPERGENRDISDDELFEALRRMRSGSITVILDCCHSGSLTRGEQRARQAPLDPRPAVGPRLRRPPGERRWLPLSCRGVMIAACQAEETAGMVGRTIDGVPARVGALTAHLCEVLGTSGASEASWSRLFERIRLGVSLEIGVQHPAFWGDGAARPLSLGVGVGLPGLPLLRRVGSSVVLGGGAALGVLVGSRWGVTGAGLDPLQDGDGGLAELEVAQVSGTTASAVVVQGALPASLEGLRAVELSRPLGGDGLQVVVDPSLPAALGEGVGSSPLLRRVEAGPIRIGARQDDGRWAVLDRGVEVLRPARPERPDAVDRLVGGLERLSRARRLAALESPHAAGLHLELELYAGATAEALAPVRPVEGALPVLYQGGFLGFVLHNRSSLPLWVSVFNLGLLGDVALAYVSELIPPGGADDGFARLGGAELGFPRGFDGLRDAVGQPRTEGLDALVAIGTTAPADLSALEQRGYRGGEGLAPDGLTALLGAALTGRRDLLRLKAPARDAWTVARAAWILRG